MRTFLIALCVLTQSCICVHTSRGWQIIDDYPTMAIAQRQMTKCFETPHGMTVFTDGTMDCPDEGRMVYAANRIAALTYGNVSEFDGANVIFTKDRIDGDPGATLGKVAFVNIEGMWATACHEMAHILGKDHGKRRSGGLKWRIYEKCSNGYRETP